MFGENDEELNLKAKRLFAAGMTPIFCIGETEAQYDAGETENVIRTQLAAGLKDLCPKCVSKMVIAYEPIWAIGTGKTATPEVADETCGYVRSVIKEMYGAEVSEAIRILYGGSVKPSNVDELMAKENIDGGLVGGASLEAESFLKLVKACVK
jgi:triosephosphate isomerase